MKKTSTSVLIQNHAYQPSHGMACSIVAPCDAHIETSMSFSNAISSGTDTPQKQMRNASATFHIERPLPSGCSTGPHSARMRPTCSPSSAPTRSDLSVRMRFSFRARLGVPCRGSSSAAAKEWRGLVGDAAPLLRCRSAFSRRCRSSVRTPSSPSMRVAIVLI
jgi:hypothetical protein